MSDGHIWLMPHNPAFTPIAGDGATVLGKVVSVLAPGPVTPGGRGCR